MQDLAGGRVEGPVGEYAALGAIAQVALTANTRPMPPAAASPDELAAAGVPLVVSPRHGPPCAPLPSRVPPGPALRATPLVLPEDLRWAGSWGGALLTVACAITGRRAALATEVATQRYATRDKKVGLALRALLMVAAPKRRVTMVATTDSLGDALMEAEAHPTSAVRPSHALGRQAMHAVKLAMARAGYGPDRIRNTAHFCGQLARAARQSVEVAALEAADAGDAALHAACRRFVRACADGERYAKDWNSEAYAAETLRLDTRNLACVSMGREAFLPRVPLRYLVTILSCEMRSMLADMERVRSSPAGHERFLLVGAVLLDVAIPGRQVLKLRHAKAGRHFKVLEMDGRMRFTRDAEKTGGPDASAHTIALPVNLGNFVALFTCEANGLPSWPAAEAAEAPLLGKRVSMARAYCVVLTQVLGLSTFDPAAMRRSLCTEVGNPMWLHDVDALLGDAPNSVRQAAAAAVAAAQRATQAGEFDHGHATYCRTYRQRVMTPAADGAVDGAVRATLPWSDATAAAAREVSRVCDRDGACSPVAVAAMWADPVAAATMFPNLEVARCAGSVAGVAMRNAAAPPVKVPSAGRARAAGVDFMRRHAIGEGATVHMNTVRDARIASIVDAPWNPAREMEALCFCELVGLGPASWDPVSRPFTQRGGGEFYRSATGAAVIVEHLAGAPPPARDTVVPPPRRVVMRPLVSPHWRAEALAFRLTAAFGPGGGRHVLQELRDTLPSMAETLFSYGALFEAGCALFDIPAGANVFAYLEADAVAVAAVLHRVECAVGLALSHEQAAHLCRFLSACADAHVRSLNHAFEAPSRARAARVLMAKEVVNTQLAVFKTIHAGGQRDDKRSVRLANVVFWRTQLPAMAEAVDEVMRRVLEDVRRPLWYALRTPEQRALRRDVQWALWALSPGTVTFDFVRAWRLFETVFILRDQFNVPRWHVMPPVRLHGHRPAGPRVVPLSTVSQAFVDWLVATMPAGTAHILAENEPKALKRRRR